MNLFSVFDSTNFRIDIHGIFYWTLVPYPVYWEPWTVHRDHHPPNPPGVHRLLIDNSFM